MPSVIELEHLTKAFGDVVAVDDIELAIARGEIVCLLGPSGCGKTTTLRMVAGFDRPTKGEIKIAGVVVSSGSTLIPPERRNLGMVFQNYAVWPHMTVFRNIAYPLRIKKVPRREIQKKVDEAIQLTGLTGLAKRYPEQLSGGQQQRVALARALVVQPVAMLLDEPLSNLDAKLREKMRFEIMDLHRRTGITVLYVTHDQAEAMVLSDRIVVMNEGRIDQIGSPGEIYRQPRSAFVADFIGLANFARATLVESSGSQGRAAVAGVEDISFPCEVPVGAEQSREGLLFVRPEDIRLTEKAGGTLRGIVRRRTFLGNQVDYRIEAVGKEWRVEVNPDVTIPEGSAVGMSVQRAVFLPEAPGEGAS
ncbi:MAG: ABC transporter ATP-binding protein [Candidatus Bipolaricaulis sp.]|nr:ABC transporter ATP-binding protein [Candidatus Bipolaricaulis sp.]